MNHKRKELLALPNRKYEDGSSMYDALYLVPSGRKHDSGWMQIAIVGIRSSVPIEIAAWPDDINWIFCEKTQAMRTDCTYPSGIIHVWTRRNHQFLVSESLSSVDIALVARDS